MAKTEVYSWRVAAETKQALEAEARRQRMSLAAMLEHIVGEWLRQQCATSVAGDEEQKRLHEAAAKAIGAIDSAPDLSLTASERIRKSLKKRYAR
jgi:hypothetical protein